MPTLGEKNLPVIDCDARMTEARWVGQIALLDPPLHLPEQLLALFGTRAQQPHSELEDLHFGITRPFPFGPARRRRDRFEKRDRTQPLWDWGGLRRLMLKEPAPAQLLVEEEGEEHLGGFPCEPIATGRLGAVSSHLAFVVVLAASRCFRGNLSWRPRADRQTCNEWQENEPL